MPRIDSEKFYTSAIDNHGITAQGLGWHSIESQEIRFDTLLEMLPKDLSDVTIADAGCGFGDFYLYMLEKGVTPKKYIGIDSLESMCEIASMQTATETIVADICKDELPSAEYYVCSGAMNVLNSFETHLFIRNCYHACNNAFIFNILHGDIESETYNYVTTEQIKQIAKELNVWHVEMKTGYFENDITVAFLKEWD
jgi:SAM-dependent methyltransferase